MHTPPGDQEERYHNFLRSCLRATECGNPLERLGFVSYVRRVLTRLGLQEEAEQLRKHYSISDEWIYSVEVRR